MHAVDCQASRILVSIEPQARDMVGVVPVDAVGCTSSQLPVEAIGAKFSHSAQRVYAGWNRRLSG